MAEASTSSVRPDQIASPRNPPRLEEDEDSSLYSNESGRTSGDLSRASFRVEPIADVAPDSVDKPALRPSTSLARRFHQVEREDIAPAVQRELKFSVKWGDDVRSFSLDTKAINTITYRDLTDLFEITGDVAQPSWPSRARGQQRRSKGLFGRLVKRRKEEEEWSLFIEHQSTDVRPTSRPRSTWSILNPWQDDDSLQVHLVRDFLRKRAMEQAWVMVLVRKNTQGGPGDDVAWSPSGLDRLGKGLSRLSWGLGNLLGTSNQNDTEARNFCLLDEEGGPESHFPSYSSIFAAVSAQSDRPYAHASTTTASEGRKRRPSLADVFRKSTASRRYGQQGNSGEHTALLAESRAEAGGAPLAQDALRPPPAPTRPRSWRISGKSEANAARSETAQPPVKKRKNLFKVFIPAFFRDPATDSPSNDSEATSSQNQGDQQPRPWLEPSSLPPLKAKPRSASSPSQSQLHTRTATDRGQLFERVDLPDADPSPRPKYGQLPAIPGRVVSLSKSSHVYTRWAHNSSLSLDSHPTGRVSSVDSVHHRRQPAHLPKQRYVMEKTETEGVGQDIPIVRADAVHKADRAADALPPSHSAPAIDTAGNRLWHFKPRRKRPSKMPSYTASQSDGLPGALQAKNISPPLERLGRGASIVSRPEDARAGMRRAWTDGV